MSCVSAAWVSSASACVRSSLTLSSTLARALVSASGSLTSPASRSAEARRSVWTSETRRSVLLMTPVQMVSTLSRLSASPDVVPAAKPHSAIRETKGMTSSVEILNLMDLPDAMTPAPG